MPQRWYVVCGLLRTGAKFPVRNQELDNSYRFAIFRVISVPLWSVQNRSKTSSNILLHLVNYGLKRLQLEKRNHREPRQRRLMLVKTLRLSKRSAGKVLAFSSTTVSGKILLNTKAECHRIELIVLSVTTYNSSLRKQAVPNTEK